MNRKTLASFFDLANHHADAKPEDVKSICRKVIEFGFNGAFVNACYVELAKDELKEKAGVGTVISFPLGQDSTEAKVMAAIDGAKKGADELDVSMNVGWFLAGRGDEVLGEMKRVVEAAKGIRKLIVVKFIIETGFLSDEQIKRASLSVAESGADFVKTNSGMGPRGVRPEDVRLIRAAVGDKVKIKAAGGIDKLQEALDLIEAGVDRMGTSKAVEIIREIGVTNE